jgi:transposase
MLRIFISLSMNRSKKRVFPCQKVVTVFSKREHWRFRKIDDVMLSNKVDVLFLTLIIAPSYKNLQNKNNGEYSSPQ